MEAWKEGKFKKMDIKNKATQINLFSLKTIQMRTFHTTWFAFFLAFFGWFGVAPLMAIVREDLMLTKTQKSVIQLSPPLLLRYWFAS